MIAVCVSLAARGPRHFLLKQKIQKIAKIAKESAGTSPPKHFSSSSRGYRCRCCCAECLQQHSKLLQVNRLQSARRIAALIKRQQWQLFSVGNTFAMHSLSRCCLLQPLQQHSPSSITCHPGCHRVPLQKHVTNFPKLLQN